MSLLALELNDIGITAVRSDDREALAGEESPGYAVLDGDQVATGIEARSRARLKPRFTHTRFWDALDTSPLERPFPSKLSCADLAHTHLKEAWRGVRGADEADDAILAVPGWYSLDQLGLILGIARACDIPVSGMIDSALAAAAGAPTGEARSRAHVVHLDLHLHRVAAARVLRLDQLVREDTVVDEDIGLVKLHDAWATLVAQTFVRQTRFDPLHAASAEQDLYNLLPGWLDQLGENEAATLAMEASGRKHQIEIDRQQLIQTASPYYESITALAVSILPHDEPVTVLLSHRLARLPGMVAKLARDVADEIVALPPQAAAAGALTYESHGAKEPREDDGLTFLTRLELDEHGRPSEGVRPVPESVAEGRPPTHVLFSGVAHPIDPEPFLLGVSIPEGRRGLNLVGETAGVSRYHCSIYRSNDRVMVEDHSKFGSFLNGRRIHERAPLSVGDTLRLGTPGIEIQLIEVGR